MYSYIVEREIRKTFDHVNNHRWDEAVKFQDRLYPLHAALFSDASPGPTNYALSRVRSGFPVELRLPMVEPSDASKRAVDAALDHAGLI